MYVYVYVCVCARACACACACMCVCVMCVWGERGMYVLTIIFCVCAYICIYGSSQEVIHKICIKKKTYTGSRFPTG